MINIIPTLERSWWLVVCIVFSYFTRRRPDLLVGAAILVWLLIPSLGGYLITHFEAGSLSFLPSTWLIVIGMIFQLLFRLQPLLDSFRRYLVCFIGLVLVVAIAVLTTKVGKTGAGLVVMDDEILAPALLFWLIVSSVREFPRFLSGLRTLVVSISVAESIFAIAQWIAKSPILFVDQFHAAIWFTPGWDRWFGTIDHPLGLSFLLCVGTALLSSVRRPWLQLPALAVIATGILITQSRTGLAFVALAAIWLIARSSASAIAKVFIYVAFAGVSVWVFTTSVAAGVGSRLANDGGSANARGDAVNYFLTNLNSYLFKGGGVGSSYALGRKFDLTTSLESSILMYAVDLGVVFALVYFGIQVYLIARTNGRPRLPGLTLAGIAVILIPQSYSGLASQSPAGLLVWLVCGMCAGYADLPPGATDVLRLPPRRSALGPARPVVLNRAFDPAPPEALAAAGGGRHSAV